MPNTLLNSPSLIHLFVKFKGGNIPRYIPHSTIVSEISQLAWELQLC